jgi:2-phospho-L-lactate guanylyltransferase
MRSLIPFAATEPKTRLAPVLDPDERAAFARVMLSSVVETVIAAGLEPTVLATAQITDPLPAAASTVVDDQPLTAAVNEQLAADSPTLVVMADLPLLRAADIHDLVGTDADLTIAPGLGGGTNAFCTREPAFRVDYHGASYLDHCEIAADCGATVETVDSRRLATDIDELGDLAEVLIHGDGAAREWLVDAGFELDTDDGRVGVRRQ